MKRIALLAVLLLVPLAACDEDNDTSTTIGAPSVAPLVECCDFKDRENCRMIREGLLAKRGFLRKNDICFDKCGRCFTNCPD